MSGTRELKSAHCGCGARLLSTMALHKRKWTKNRGNADTPSINHSDTKAKQHSLQEKSRCAVCCLPLDHFTIVRESFPATAFGCIWLGWAPPHRHTKNPLMLLDTDRRQSIVSQQRRNFTACTKTRRLSSLSTVFPSRSAIFFFVPFQPFFKHPLSHAHTLAHARPINKNLFCIKVSGAHKSIVLAEDADTRGHTRTDSA